jgi:hypothetical protein
MRPVYDPLAHRFANTFRASPPGCDHELYVIANGGPIGDYGQRIFAGLNAKFIIHNNLGKDIGAFQMAADRIKCDLLVCLGAPIHFTRPGWLKRIYEAYVENGPHLYGAWGFRAPAPHIRTTAFWMPPELLQSYPNLVVNSTRYEFEHGGKSFTRHVISVGLECLMVTWNGVYGMDGWDRGDPSDWLMLDQHSDRQGIK